MKKAFTVAEILISLSIVAVISVVTVIMVKPSDKVMGTLYLRAFTTLQLAALNSFNNYENDAETVEDIHNFVGNGLCNRLIQYINTGEKNPSCHNSEFTAMNGMIFRVGNRRYQISNSNGQNYYNFYFRVVEVDLNGNTRPNSSIYSERGIMSDIVSFAVLDNGDVIPIGLHAQDPRYLLVDIIREDNIGERSFIRTSMPFCDAKKFVWGNSLNKRDLISFADRIDNEVYGDTFCTRSGSANINCRGNNKCFIEFQRAN